MPWTPSAEAVPPKPDAFDVVLPPSDTVWNLLLLDDRDIGDNDLLGDRDTFLCGVWLLIVYPLVDTVFVKATDYIITSIIINLK